MSSQRINISGVTWGSKGWFFIDTIVLSYPDYPSSKDKEEYKNFILSMQKVLPCEKCRKHFRQFMEKNPLNDKVLSSKKSFVEWILAAHNNVRKMQNKDQISLDDFYNYYIKENNLEINKDTSEVRSNITENEHFYIPNYTSLISIVGIFIVFMLLVMVKYKKD